jgi:predicted enzyme related to lactoylglutathione lyase
VRRGAGFLSLSGIRGVGNGDGGNLGGVNPNMLEFDLVTIDAVDSVALARFWGAALGLEVVETEDNDRWIVLGSASNSRVLGIQRIQNLSFAEARIEGAAKVRVHIDLRCDQESFDAEVDRVVALGAHELRPRRRESYGYIATLADVEGNVFDVCAYE